MSSEAGWGKDQQAGWGKDTNAGWDVDQQIQAELATGSTPVKLADLVPEAKAKLGSGARFKSLEKKLEKEEVSVTEVDDQPIDDPMEEAVNDPAAVAASIGIKKYGKKKMEKMAQAGKRRKHKR